MTTIQPLFVDLYQKDLNGVPNWNVLEKLGPPWHGAILKATEGTYYHPPWFKHNWQLVRSVGLTSGRYDTDTSDWFRGAYHFLKFNQDGVKQADFYLAAVEAAGGWDVGDFWPVVDVELGGEKNSNQLASKQQIVDVTTAFAHRCTEILGRKVVLYGNGAMHERGITDRMGCSYLWPARYTETLPKRVYEDIGWSLETLLLWQFCGDGVAKLAGYPHEVPGFGKVDISALVIDGGIDWLRSHLFAEDPTQ